MTATTATIILAIFLGITSIVFWMIIGGDIEAGVTDLGEHLMKWLCTIVLTTLMILAIISAAKSQVKTKIPPTKLIIIRQITQTTKDENVKQDTVYIYKFK